jgi:hypothetical protein
MLLTDPSAPVVPWSPSTHIDGLSSDEELAAWLAWALGLVLAREWLVRRAGGSGCEPVTLDAESFPVCPPGSCRTVSLWRRTSLSIWT